MAITSYRIYCNECSRNEVIREDYMDEHPWKIEDKTHHSGLCPVCNSAFDDSAADFDDGIIEVAFTELRGIGDKTAENLRSAGYETKQDIREASDEELSSISGVGKTSIDSLRSAT